MTLKAGECVFCWLLFLCFYFFQEEIHGCLGQVVLSEFHESLAEVLEFYFFFLFCFTLYVESHWFCHCNTAAAQRESVWWDWVAYLESRQ